MNEYGIWYILLSVGSPIVFISLNKPQPPMAFYFCMARCSTPSDSLLSAASVGEVFAYYDKVPGFTIFLKNVVCKWLNLWLLFLTCRVYFGRFMMI